MLAGKSLPALAGNRPLGDALKSQTLAALNAIRREAAAA